MIMPDMGGEKTYSRMKDINPDVKERVTVHGFWVQGSEVQGSGFTVGHLAVFISLEIIDKSTNGGTCSAGLLIDIFELVGRYVPFIQSNIKFALDLTARPLRVP